MAETTDIGWELELVADPHRHHRKRSSASAIKRAEMAHQLRKSGFGYRDISKLMRVSHSAVANYLARHYTNGSMRNPEEVRPRKMWLTDREQAIRLRKEERMSVKEIVSWFHENVRAVSDKTVYRWLSQGAVQ